MVSLRTVVTFVTWLISRTDFSIRNSLYNDIFVDVRFKRFGLREKVVALIANTSMFVPMNLHGVGRSARPTSKKICIPITISSLIFCGNGLPMCLKRIDECFLPSNVFLNLRYPSMCPVVEQSPCSSHSLRQLFIFAS